MRWQFCAGMFPNRRHLGNAMPVPVEPDGPGWRIIAIGAWALVTTLFGIIANRLRTDLKEQGARIDLAYTRLESTVNKEDFRDALATFRAERDAQHKDNRDERIRLHEETLANFEKLSQKLDSQAVQDQRILQLERDLAAVCKYAEDLKHMNVDPYVRATAVLESRVKALENDK